ncbi:MAG: carbonate dehydratase [Acidobacteria bacterium]|nr:carbonate dehydratase [Acidobacteriota bacterium]
MKTINELLESNRKWADEMKGRDPSFFEELVEGQQPEILWISCSDSRISPSSSIGLLPGEMFVHRNVANLVVHSDMNCLSVMQFAVEVLKIRHIIICGHYGCGGVKAAFDDSRFGLIDNWLRHVQDLIQKHSATLNAIEDDRERLDKLCEINVVEQVINVGETTIVRTAWEAGWDITVHGWIYTIADGIYRDMGISIDNAEALRELRQRAATGL